MASRFESIMSLWNFFLQFSDVNYAETVVKSNKNPRNGVKNEFYVFFFSKYKYAVLKLFEMNFLFIR